MFHRNTSDIRPLAGHLERREFLKGIISLGILTLLSYLLPSCLSKSEQTPEAIIPISPSDIPVINDEKEVTKTADTLDTSKRTPLAILYRQELQEYNFGTRRLYTGSRYRRFIDFLQETLPEADNYRIIKADPATRNDLIMLCSKEYIDITRDYYKAANLGLSRPEQFNQYHSKENVPGERPGKIEEAARLIVGQAKKACDLIQDGQYDKVVSIGGGMHHARPDFGEAFCVYNDVAFCALYLMQVYGLERVLILDTDAHAGNGTSEYFYNDPRVLLIDLHQDPATLYPASGFINEIGSGKGKGFTINIPMPVGASYYSYQLAFESIVEPVTKEFKPQIIIWEGGSDPHFGDRICELGLNIEGFKMMGEKVRVMSDICGGKAICLTCSGYNRKYRNFAWMAFITRFGGIELNLEELESFPEQSGGDTPSTEPASISDTIRFTEMESIITELRSQLKDYWTCLR